MFTLLTYNPQQPTKSNFYIQSKGLHAGRPMREPIPNCFCVFSENKNLYELVYSLWVGRMFEPNIIGSVIPFIRIKEAREVINKGVKSFKPERIKHLKAIDNIDKLLIIEEKRYKQLKQLKVAYALSLFK